VLLGWFSISQCWKHSELAATFRAFGKIRVRKPGRKIRLIDLSITHLEAAGPSRTCAESNKEEEGKKKVPQRRSLVGRVEHGPFVLHIKSVPPHVPQTHLSKREIFIDN
jgi:hypothetical protein